MSAAALRISRIALLSCAAMLAACGGSENGLLGETASASASATDNAREEAALAALAARIALTIEAGGVGGSPGGTVRVTVGSSPAVSVSAGSSDAFTITAGDAVTLAASGDEGYRFAGWTLSGGLSLSCEPPTDSEIRCELDTESAMAGASVVAAFAVSGNAIEVAVGPGGDLRFSVGDRSPGRIPAGSGDGFIVPPEDAVTLTAEPRGGYRFTRWALPSGLACMREPDTAETCELAAGSVDAAKAVAAVFEAINYVLTVGSGSGEIAVAIDSAYVGTIRAGESKTALVTVENAVTLTAAAAAGYAFAIWTLSGPPELACESGAELNPCVLPAGSVSTNTTVAAAFEAIQSTLTVAAGANGSVDVEVGGADAGTVDADSERGFPVTILSSAKLTAIKTTGYRFAGWTLSGGVAACAPGMPGTDANICELEAGSVSADATVSAAFEVVPTTLTVAAGTGGLVAASIGVADAMTVSASSSQGFPFSVETAATLSAISAGGYEFAGWMLSPPGLACAPRTPGTDANICALEAGSVSADATVSAAFEAVPTTLTVAAGTGGLVAASIGVAEAMTVSASFSQGFPFSVETAATLMATPADGYEFAGWTLSGGVVACARETAPNSCQLPTGSVTADATVSAAFDVVPTILTVIAGANGSVDAEIAGKTKTIDANSSQGFAFSVEAAATLRADPADDYALARWTFSGPSGLACAPRTPGTDANICELEVGSVTSDATVKAAFEITPIILTVKAQAGGDVAAEVAGAVTDTVFAASEKGFPTNILSTATLTAVPFEFYRFERWTLSGGLTCESGRLSNPCVVPTGGFRADATLKAAFKVIPSTLTVAAGANGAVFVGAMEIRANSSRSFTFSVEGEARLRAIPDNNYAFSSWTLSPDGLACESGPRTNPCVLPVGSVRSDAKVSAAFGVPHTLRVTAGANGWVDTEIDGDRAVRVTTRRDFTVTDVSVTTLTATAVQTGFYRFERWTLSSGLNCESGRQTNPCVLPTGSLTADAMVSAAFGPIPRTLTVIAGDNGSVVAVTGDGARRVDADSRHGFIVNFQSAATTLRTEPAGGYRFARWTLSGPSVACESGTEIDPCVLPTGSGSADATVEASFEIAPSTLTVTAGGNGAVQVRIEGDVGFLERTITAAEELSRSQSFAFNVSSMATLRADPADHYEFSRWTQSGRGRPACASDPQVNPCVLPTTSIEADATLEAVFRPIERSLTVSVSPPGINVVSATITYSDGRSEEDRGSSLGFRLGIEDMTTLMATADAGWAFGRWTLSGPSGLACESGKTDDPTCVLPIGSVTADATAEANFEPIPSTLTVSVSPIGINVVSATITYSDNSGREELVNSSSNAIYPFDIEATATLMAEVLADGYEFSHWRLSGGGALGLACASRTRRNLCMLPTGSVKADATVEAVFTLIERTLRVAAGVGGEVDVAVVGDDAARVLPGEPRDFIVTIQSRVTLRSEPLGGYRLLSVTSGLADSCADSFTNPCRLRDVFDSDHTFTALFEAVTTTLTVAAGAGGSVEVAVGEAITGTIPAGSDLGFGFDFNVETSATLRASTGTGYKFDRWTLSGGVAACESGMTTSTICVLPAGSVTADATVKANFLILSTLTVTAGPGGSVAAEVAGAEAVTIDADSDEDFTVTVLSTATLTAVPATGHRFAGWELRGGVPSERACASGLGVNPCVLPTDSVSANVMLKAAFEPVTTILTVVAGTRGEETGGEVTADVAGSKTTVAANSSQGFAFNILSAATLTATVDAGWRFTGWTLSGAQCESGTQVNPCVLPAGSVTTNTTVQANFRTNIFRLEIVVTRTRGRVDVFLGDDTFPVPSRLARNIPFTVLDTARLQAFPRPGWTFDFWSPQYPGELPCSGGEKANPCLIPMGQTGSEQPGNPPRQLLIFPRFVQESRLASASGGGAAPARGAFEGRAGASCGGSEGPSCDASPVIAGEILPAAAFRPFTVDGIKSLAFWPGRHGGAPDHFRISFRDAPGTGFTPVPGLMELAPGAAPARLAVSVHLLPWGLGAYLTEACDASGDCEAADGGERTLGQADSIAATGYFKAPNAGAEDLFGAALALSGDGATLAVGAPFEGSASAGAFAPGGDGYQAALDSDGALGSGAAYVYRRSTGGLWTVEAFVKAPNAGAEDLFGAALALSGDGATLAVGAPGEGSASAGAFAPGGDGYQAALDSDGAPGSGAATVYRRPAGGLWTVEAFVKAPKGGSDDAFGAALALSADGATLAVGAPGEGSASAGAFAPGGDGYQAALDSDGAPGSGAATVYRRPTGGLWTVEAFVKAPDASEHDGFGSALALSGDGARLAVGAPFGGGGSSGSAYVYRRSGSAWGVEASVAAAKAGDGDNFGSALALSADGAMLAVGASGGTFTPTGEGYQAALDGDGAQTSGGATVYRRSGSAWSVAAFVKAPGTGREDHFGKLDLALSPGGVVMAVTSSGEDSSFSGAFAPGGAGHQAALDSGDGSGSGAAAIYRRPAGAGAWTAGNFVKAPNTGGGDRFGSALALSGDGSTLAVGAPGEDGGPQPQPGGGDSADTGNPLRDSGAVYLY